MFDKCAPEEHEGVILRRFSFRESTSHRPRRRTLSGVNLHHHRRNSIYIITAGEGEREARVRSRSRSRSGSAGAGRRSRATSVASTERGRGPRPAKSESFRVENGELAPPLPLPSPPPFLGLDPLTHGTKATTPVPAGPDSVVELTVPTPMPKPQSQPPPEPQPEPQTQLSPLREFWLHIRPIDMEEWPSKPWLARIIEIIKAPIYFILTVTTPVVDYENDKHNWCRLLNSLHCVLSPLFITLVATGGDDTVGGVPVIVIVALAFACVAGTVFATSTYEDPPRYHWVFGYVGFLVAVAWIYLLANEVLSLLKTFGIVIGLSDAFLGMTVLAWGNSIGAQLGLSKLKWTTMIGILYGTITTTLVSTLVAMIIMRFHVKRAFGALLVLLYVIYTVVAILIEAKVI
ncbi:hypothetical protein HPB49_018447 [Dermacentor silvarum]|uniref:Uncharacterized protein n=1 Tax=Dermacentor silvarum TaxID=543639 RepID=A0ACB8D736_DERSI|nr:hypothetical protein HPB49_018447 [Dermacentor silvarum]